MFSTCMVIFLFYGIAHADLKDGLVAYYPFNGNANDERGNGGNYGTVYGATLEVGRFGKQYSAYKFNGINNYIFSNGYNFVGSKMSVNVWIKTSNNDSDTSGKAIIELTNAVIYMSRNSYLGKIMTAFDGSTIGQTDHGTVSVNDDKWHLITCTNDGSTTSIYIDSKLDTKYGDIGIGGNVTQFTIGAISAKRAFWDGSIDDIRIYNRVLSESEITQLYQEGTNSSPIITSFTAIPKVGNPPLTVNFNISAKDLDGSIAEYRWDFDGNGKIDDTTILGEVTNTYFNLGLFNSKVTVVDNDGAKTKSKSIPIVVAHGPELIGKIDAYDFTDTSNTIHIDFKVSNTGNIAAPPFKVRFHLSENGKVVLPAFKEVDVTNGLNIGTNTLLQVDNTFAESIYGKYVLIFVDPVKQVAEIDETNNGTKVSIQPMETK